MTNNQSTPTLLDALRTGAIFGLVALFVALVGLVEAFSEVNLISGGRVIETGMSLGLTWLLMVAFSSGYVLANQSKDADTQTALLNGLVSGLAIGLVIGLYLLITNQINIRGVFVNSSPALAAILTFQKPLMVGVVLQLVLNSLLGLGGAALNRQPVSARKPIARALITLLLVGIMQDLIEVMFNTWGEFTLGNISFSFLDGVIEFFLAKSGLTLWGATTIFVLVIAITAFQPQLASATAPARDWLNHPERKKTKYGINFSLTGIALILLPGLLGIYFSDVLDNVGLYILMGLGLNIVVGFAGLLDLGYVAFFAIGAYVMGILTSPASILGWEWTFWQALPFSMIVSGLAGMMLGIPVLRMRGDYLAIVTLGFGEIIRILATSDLLKQFIGGPQGILQIPKPIFFGTELINPQQIYYVILVAVLLAYYISWRLSDSRVGRTWIAIREDEDVAEAMGINLVRYKLMAFSIGATLAGLAGGIFASKLSSIFPHSFNLLISINVLSLIIVGGMGSLPGVVVGAFVLVGLPELLREFAEFRLLMYGALLVVMMLLRPEGFWPATHQKRELHSDDPILVDAILKEGS